jgi:hypothetical protein
MAAVNTSPTNSAKRFYNPTGVSGVYASTHSLNFSRDERRAGSRAILRHNEHAKDYFLTRTTGGLHPIYIALHGIRGCSRGEKEEVDALLMGTMQDLFDTVSTLSLCSANCPVMIPIKAATLDRADGGITLILRCPGHRATSVEDLTVNTYISPRELKEGGKELSKHIALIIQAFGTDIALPYLHRFAKQCDTEEIESLFAPSKLPSYIV